MTPQPKDKGQAKNKAKKKPTKHAPSYTPTKVATVFSEGTIDALALDQHLFSSGLSNMNCSAISGPSVEVLIPIKMSAKTFLSFLKEFNGVSTVTFTPPHQPPHQIFPLVANKVPSKPMKMVTIEAIYVSPGWDLSDFMSKLPIVGINPRRYGQGVIFDVSEEHHKDVASLVSTLQLVHPQIVHFKLKVWRPKVGCHCGSLKHKSCNKERSSLKPCVNCGGNHVPTDKTCPIFRKEREAAFRHKTNATHRYLGLPEPYSEILRPIPLKQQQKTKKKKKTQSNVDPLPPRPKDFTILSRPTPQSSSPPSEESKIKIETLQQLIKSLERRLDERDNETRDLKHMLTESLKATHSITKEFAAFRAEVFAMHRDRTEVASPTPQPPSLASHQRTPSPVMVSTTSVFEEEPPTQNELTSSSEDAADRDYMRRLNQKRDEAEKEKARQQRARSRTARLAEPSVTPQPEARKRAVSLRSRSLSLREKKPPGRPKYSEEYSELSMRVSSASI